MKAKLHEIDYWLLNYIHQRFISPQWDRAGHLISMTGNFAVGWLLALSSSWLIGLLSQDFILIAWLVTLTVTVSFLTEICKLAFRRPRPFLAIINPISYRGKRPPRSTSFFSGHATTAAFAAMGSWLLIGGWFAVISIIWALAVGLSRLQQAAHYPFDVLVGWIVGVAIGLTIIPLL